jgi:two-component system sensor histidine kinase MtrB
VKALRSPARRRRGSGRPGLGLRTRVTIAFAVGAAVTSGAVAGSTYALVHHYLLSQRQTSAITQSYTNARLVRQDLNASGSDVTDVLSSLNLGASSRSLVYRRGRWFSASVAVGRSSLPASLTAMVMEGHPAYQRITVAGAPAVAVGIPLPAIGVDYFEVHSLAELQTTLDTVAVVLVLAAVVIALGGAGLGWWASARLVRPLRDVAGVAEAISSGELDRRLSGPSDADLAPLVAAFNRMVDALQQRIEREQRFTSDVSHELRSPLTAVETSAEVLSMFRSCLPAQGNKALDLLRLETGRFSAMVEDLLEISRMDAGAAELAKEDVDLSELLRFATGAAQASPASPGRRVPLQISPAADGVLVRADKRRLLRVVANLLDNAERHGGGAVAVGLDRLGPWALVTVEDAGPGVPPDERAQVFERFYRGSGASSLRQGGSGLGLALVAEHVRVHGGSIEITDRRGGGASFVVRLPVVGS